MLPGEVSEESIAEGRLCQPLLGMMGAPLGLGTHLGMYPCLLLNISCSGVL